MIDFCSGHGLAYIYIRDSMKRYAAKTQWASWGLSVSSVGVSVIPFTFSILDTSPLVWPAPVRTGIRRAPPVLSFSS